MGRIRTPCNKVCVIDPKLEICIGCYRTLDEITRWSSMTTNERNVVMERIKKERLVDAETTY